MGRHYATDGSDLEAQRGALARHGDAGARQILADRQELITALYLSGKNSPQIAIERRRTKRPKSARILDSDGGGVVVGLEAMQKACL
jgi:hypothetical protein